MNLALCLIVSGVITQLVLFGINRHALLVQLRNDFDYLISHAVGCTSFHHKTPVRDLARAIGNRIGQLIDIGRRQGRLDRMHNPLAGFTGAEVEVFRGLPCAGDVAVSLDTIASFAGVTVDHAKLIVKWLVSRGLAELAPVKVDGKQAGRGYFRTAAGDAARFYQA